VATITVNASPTRIVVEDGPTLRIGGTTTVDVDGVPQAFADLGNPEAHAKILVVP
jgi:hypothetical protein